MIEFRKELARGDIKSYVSHKDILALPCSIEKERYWDKKKYYSKISLWYSDGVSGWLKNSMKFLLINAQGH